MTTFFASLLYIYGDGKPHPVEGIILFLILFLAIICFNKWVIRSEKTHERHYKSDKVLKRERSLSNRFWYSILQIIEFFCGAYFRRGTCSLDEPFRKATVTEKRVGGCFMVLWPLFFAFMTSHTESFGAMVDSMTYGHLWMGWFYIGFITLIGSAVVFLIKVAPKIPLFVSGPLAAASWLVLFWVVWKHNLI
jgi:hypothetical protein